MQTPEGEVNLGICSSRAPGISRSFTVCRSELPSSGATVWYKGDHEYQDTRPHPRDQAET